MNKLNIETFLKEGKIIDSHETYETLRKRVIDTIVGKEQNFGVPQNEQNLFKQKLEIGFYEKEFVPSTTILTNAGRYEDKPLAACSVPSVDLRRDLSKVKTIVDHYHNQGMGTGFNFDEVEDPVSTLLYLNDIALENAKNGKQDRPVGNMGLISINHPKIEEFIHAKDKEQKNKEWMFNISINLKEDFIAPLKNKRDYTLADGKKVNSNLLMNIIAESACSCGDPGIIFLERFERDNPTPHLGTYKSLAPCGEVALAEGETCQFSYINVSKFVKEKQIEYEKLRGTIDNVVRFLDDALEKSIENYGNKKSEDIMVQKRKIGVGICGFADLLIRLEMSYDSEEARNIAQDIMSFVNYNTKVASVKLAKERGAFPAFYHPETKMGEGYITQRYGGLESRTVSKQDWKKLDEEIQKYGIRHVSTTALPPTGRSSTIIGTSPSIEPLFSLELTDLVKETLDKMLKERGYPNDFVNHVYEQVEQDECCGKIKNMPENVKAVFKTCLEISPEAHLTMVAEFQKFTDESVAKTVNVANNTSPQEVKEIYMKAYDLGLKGITVYRDGSKAFQPKLRRKENG